MKDIHVIAGWIVALIWAVGLWLSLSAILNAQMDTLRLLRRGDKIDCSQSEMRGRQP